MVFQGNVSSAPMRTAWISSYTSQNCPIHAIGRQNVVLTGIVDSMVIVGFPWSELNYAVDVTGFWLALGTLSTNTSLETKEASVLAAVTSKVLVMSVQSLNI